MKRRKRNKQHKPPVQGPGFVMVDEIAAPSRIDASFIQDRETSTVAGAPRAWRKRSELQAAYECERLGPKDSADAFNRLTAGNTYTQIWDCSQSAGRDSTAAFDVVRCMGSGIPLTERQATAVRLLVAIEMEMGANDRTIARAVLGLGYTAAEAIRLARLSIDTRVSARLCECLDALASAIEIARGKLRKQGARAYLHDE